MPVRKKAVIAKTARAFKNLKRGRTALGSGSLGVGGGMLAYATHSSSGKYFVPVMAAGAIFTFFAGPMVLKLRRKEGLLFGRCIGKLRLCDQLIESGISAEQANILLVLGHGKFNYTEKESIKKHLLNEATPMEKKYALQAFKRERERLG